MILEILADTGQVMNPIDAKLAQVIFGADSRQHQQLRGFDGAGAYNDLASGHCGQVRTFVLKLNTGCAAVMDDHPVNQGMGYQGQVGAR